MNHVDLGQTNRDQYERADTRRAINPVTVGPRTSIFSFPVTERDWITGKRGSSIPKGSGQDLRNDIRGDRADDQAHHGTLDGRAEGAERNEQNAHEGDGTDDSAQRAPDDRTRRGAVGQRIMVGRIRIRGDILQVRSRDRLVDIRSGGRHECGSRVRNRFNLHGCRCQRCEGRGFGRSRSAPAKVTATASGKAATSALRPIFPIVLRMIFLASRPPRHADSSSVRNVSVLRIATIKFYPILVGESTPGVEMRTHGVGFNDEVIGCVAGLFEQFGYRRETLHRAEC